MAIEYNVLALRGADIKDKEYVEMYNLDPSIANTPEINNVMLDMFRSSLLKAHKIANS